MRTRGVRLHIPKPAKRFFEEVCMGCILVLIGVFFPRVVIILLALTSNYLGRAFEGLLLPFLGFLFAPFTTLAFALAMNEHHSIGGIYAVVLVIAVLLDLGVIGSGKSRLMRRGRHRYERQPPA